jgi:hypothetical protein
MALPSPLRSARAAIALVTGAAFLFACMSEATPTKRKKKSPVDPGDEWYDDEYPTAEQPIEPSYVNEDSGAFGAGSRPAGGDGGGGGRPVDGGIEGGVITKIYCSGPLAAGDLAFVELLISSRAGSGDEGEWVEIQSTRPDCWLKIDGVTIESPRGQSAPNVATVPAGIELPPNGTFVVAASADPVKNNGLTGKVVAWNAADILKNDGDTITIKSGGIVIDTLTYPAFNNLETGRSLAFPENCPWSVRSSWERWSLTFTEHEPGQRGTPNEPNVDVACF